MGATGLEVSMWGRSKTPVGGEEGGGLEFLSAALPAFGARSFPAGAAVLCAARCPAPASLSPLILVARPSYLWPPELSPDVPDIPLGRHSHDSGFPGWWPSLQTAQQSKATGLLCLAPVVALRRRTF